MYISLEIIEFSSLIWYNALDKLYSLLRELTYITSKHISLINERGIFMFRKGALPISVLSALCSALFSWWVKSFAQDITVVYVAIFLAYWAFFLLAFGAIYDIAHKVKIKANKYLLGVGISAIIAFTAFFKLVDTFNIYLCIVFVTALGCTIVLGNIGAQYEKEQS